MNIYLKPIVDERLLEVIKILNITVKNADCTLCVLFDYFKKVIEQTNAKYTLNEIGISNKKINSKAKALASLAYDQSTTFSSPIYPTMDELVNIIKNLNS